MKSQSPSVARVVQLSDTHLFQDNKATLLGMNTFDSFHAVLDLIAQEQPQIHALLVTGDISQDLTADSYQHFKRSLSALSAKSVNGLHALPGNHDDYQHLQQIVPTSCLAPATIDLKRWRIILLDSQVPGKVLGHLATDQLQYLEQQLQSRQDCHVMIAFHHHPLSMNCDWLEPIGLDNSDQLWQLVDAYNHVRTVIWGHVHQASQQQRKQVQLFSVPSTCIQFLPNSKEFGVEEIPPGYRWFDLYEDGRIETQVSRVKGRTFTVDLSSRGY